MAKVGVIIPTHNRPDLLRNAIASVLCQTAGDLEVFVIDDASSTDDAERVVRAYRDDRLNYIRLSRSHGPAAARNIGLRLVTAPYVAFLDDDDEWLPEKLKIQIETLEQSPPDVVAVFTARFTVDGNTGRTWTTRYDGDFDAASAQNSITTSSILVRRAGFDVVGWFDEELETGSDADMWIRLAAVFRIRYIDEPLAKYLVHSGSLTSDLRKKARSLERLLVKHRALFSMNRAAHARLYLSLGRRYAHDGKKAKACRSLLTAMRLWPLEPRIYLNLCLLAFGKKTFNRVWDVRARRRTR